MIIYYHFGSPTQIATIPNSASSSPALALLGDDKVIVAYNKYVDSKLCICTVICDISQPEITATEEMKLMETVSVASIRSLITLLESKAYIFYYNDTSFNLKLAVCDITDDIVTLEESVVLSENERSASIISVLILPDNRIFVAHTFNENKDLAGLIYNREYIEEVSKITKLTQKIAGVAKTSGQDGQMVEVYRPNIDESEV